MHLESILRTALFLGLTTPMLAQGTALIGKGLTGWRNAKGWHNVGGVTAKARKLELTDGSGVLCNGNQRAQNILSVAEFGDVVAHIEFLVPKGSNSGVYFQGRYEVQILDSFGKEKPGFGDCGGIYERWINNKGFEGRPPRVNASKKPGEWQTFDVIFRAPRFDSEGRKVANARFVKVVHNGKVVHQNVEVTGPTRAPAFRDEKPRGPIMLQGDHGPVAYRNLRVRPATANDFKTAWWRPTEEHVRETVEGFTLLIDPRLMTKAKAKLRGQTLREIQSQLYQITRKVPKGPLANMRKVTIYVSARSETRCMAYHPSHRWLSSNGFNPKMAKCVELGNPATFLAWTKQQPWMILHELAHAYHDQFLPRGFRNADVMAAYLAAKKQGTYESILHINGGKVKHYALTNQKEYFAEATEAYFGTNDMYPFVRSELRHHDKLGYALMRKIWLGR